MSEKYSSVHYSDYLQLDKLLGAQSPRSELIGTPAHDEMLFIIIHQVYELWFKQVLHELEGIRQVMDKPVVEEKSLGKAIRLLGRISEIQKIMIAQISVLETMTPLDFLDFRGYLIPASGFQSFQFRLVEINMGLQPGKRLTYNQAPYSSVFTEEQQEILRGLESQKSLFDLIESWLERTPFLEFGDFNFKEKYLEAVANMTEKESAAIRETGHISEEEKAMRIKMMHDTKAYIEAAMDENKHRALVESGEMRLSYKATQAALLINLYRDQPILRNPYTLLNKVVDVDEMFISWRHRHAQMVLRMLGKKMGTGGSSGHSYLKQTAEQHHIFKDFHNISTLLIPRSELPRLPEGLVRRLGFNFENND